MVSLKRWLLLLLGAVAFVGCFRQPVPEKTEESGNVTVMMVSPTEGPRVLEDITEEMLIDQIISEQIPGAGEKRKERRLRNEEILFAGYKERRVLLPSADGNNCSIIISVAEKSQGV